MGQNSIALVITTIEINLDGQIAKVYGKGFVDSSNNQYEHIVNLKKKAGILKYNISSNS
jgi:ribosome-binding factor A